MGRGRAKAKQTKVARELKYSTGALDINALTAELSTSGSDDARPPAETDESDELDASESDEDAERR